MFVGEREHFSDHKTDRCFFFVEQEIGGGSRVTIHDRDLTCERSALLFYPTLLLLLPLLFSASIPM